MIVLKKSCFADIGSESITGGFMEHTSMTEEEVAVSRAITNAFNEHDGPFIPIDIDDEEIYKCLFTYNRKHIGDWVKKMILDKDIPYVLLNMIKRYFMEVPDDLVHDDIFGYIIDNYFNSFTDKMLLLTTFYGLFIVGFNDDVLAKYRSISILKWFAKELVRKILPWIHDDELFKFFSMRYVRISLDEAVADYVEKRIYTKRDSYDYFSDDESVVDHVEKHIYIERDHWEGFSEDDYDRFDEVLHQTILHVLCTEKDPEETLAKFFNENARTILAKDINPLTFAYIPTMVDIGLSKIIKNRTLHMKIINTAIYCSSDEEEWW